MKIGDIWSKVGTSNEYLYDTYDHFEVTVDALNGGWKENKEPRPWRVNFRTKPFRIAIIDNYWRME